MVALICATLLLFGTPLVFLIILILLRRKKRTWLKSLGISFATAVVWIIAVFLIGFMFFNPYDEILQKELSTTRTECKVENNFLGFFKLGSSYSDFKQAWNEFVEAKCDKYGHFYIDGIEFTAIFTQGIEKNELDSEAFQDIFERKQSWGRSSLFLDDKLIYLQVRGENNVFLGYYKESNGYSLLRKDVELLSNSIRNVLESIAKQYGEPNVLFIDISDTETLRNSMQNYIVAALNSYCRTIGPEICRWESGNITIALSLELSKYQDNIKFQDNILSSDVIISFFDNEKYDEVFLRKKLNKPLETITVESANW